MSNREAIRELTHVGIEVENALKGLEVLFEELPWGKTLLLYSLEDALNAAIGEIDWITRELEAQRKTEEMFGGA